MVFPSSCRKDSYHRVNEDILLDCLFKFKQFVFPFPPQNRVESDVSTLVGFLLSFKVCMSVFIQLCWVLAVDRLIFSAPRGILSASCEGSLVVPCELRSSWASVLALPGLSCSVAGRSLVLDQGWNRVSASLQGRFLTARPSEKSLEVFFRSGLISCRSC